MSKERTKALTPRQLEIAKLIAFGYTDKQIAKKLCITPKTVNSHVQKDGIYNRLCCDTNKNLRVQVLTKLLLENILTFEDLRREVSCDKN